MAFNRSKKNSNNKFELIVVDGGSFDASVKISQKYADIVIKSKKGRALQQNTGAKAANGECLWFLHADSKFDLAKIDLYLKSIASANWGRFAVKLSGNSVMFRVIEWFMNKRSCLTSIATGDHGIFIKTSLFNEIGGFPIQDLMEDIEISKKLKKLSPMACIDDLGITTSSRKWQEQGIGRTIFLMWKLRFLYFIGTSPKELCKRYYR